MLPINLQAEAIEAEVKTELTTNNTREQKVFRMIKTSSYTHRNPERRPYNLKYNLHDYEESEDEYEDTEDEYEDDSESETDPEDESEDEDEEVVDTGDLKKILWGRREDVNTIIIEPKTVFNTIGHQLIPVLKQRIERATGATPIILPSYAKIFMGNNKTVESSWMIVVPLVLGRTRLFVKVHIVNTETPFIIGAEFLLPHRDVISVRENYMIVNNHRVELI